MAVASTSTSIPDLAQLRPPPLVSNDSQVETQIRAKLTKKRKSRLRAFFSRDDAQNGHRSPNEEQDINETEPPLSEESQGPIPEDAIQRGPVPAERTADIFQWARLFENQRGIYVLGTPRYSSRTLLPIDPRPYTVPTAEPGALGREAMNTPYNLQDFQLPDKNWKWIGEWSVEMYGDGQVSHDGFTYNWIFRNRGWNPKARLITFVRRRSWVRLMMLPATSTPPISLSSQAQHRISVVASIKEGVWRGDDDDWERCHAALKLVDTDGKKLELMRKWTGLKSEAVRRRIQWTEDAEIPSPSESQPDQPEYYTEEPLPIDDSEANLDFVLVVLAEHYQEIAQSFKYPESRARFTEMLIQLGVHKRVPGGMISSGSGIDFWSRSNGLTDTEQSPQ